LGYETLCDTLCDDKVKATLELRIKQHNFKLRFLKITSVCYSFPLWGAILKKNFHPLCKKCPRGKTEKTHIFIWALNNGWKSEKDEKTFIKQARVSTFFLLMLFFQIGERRKNENSNYENKRISDEKLLQARLWWTSFESYKQFSFFNNNG